MTKKSQWNLRHFIATFLWVLLQRKVFDGVLNMWTRFWNWQKRQMWKGRKLFRKNLATAMDLLHLFLSRCQVSWFLGSWNSNPGYEVITKLLHGVPAIIATWNIVGELHKQQREQWQFTCQLWIGEDRKKFRCKLRISVVSLYHCHRDSHIVVDGTTSKITSFLLLLLSENGK